MFSVKKLVYTAILIALGVVLPLTLHAVPNSGQIFLPMHIPVLLSGLICGFPYSLACGVLTPLVSHLVTGMPGPAYLVPMICELAVYGLTASLLFRLIRTKNVYIRIYIALVGSMVAGRVIYGIMKALIFSAGEYSMQLWVTSMFVTALPGIAIQLVLIPAAVILLRRARVIDLEA
ncbi:MAG: ECF transporter S component [Oscillospiraceae bacterium]|jgi:niacin transporter|nr:ECF transporter S component [Oscillospiraceae bacterium]